MEKKELRIRYKKLREDLSQEEIEKQSLQIANMALQLPIWQHTYYHLFLPIIEKKEINTEYLLHILHGKDKSVIISKSNFESGEMKHYLLQENTVLKLSSNGIPEPVSGIEVPAKQLDVIFVPLLAYDKQGNRIGYGKGFYDRFLAQCNPNTIFVGLSLFEPENLIIKEQTDVVIGYCITPKKIYKF